MVRGAITELPINSTFFRSKSKKGVKWNDKTIISREVY